MDIGAARVVMEDAIFGVLAVDVTVRQTDHTSTPVSCRAVWMTPGTADEVPGFEAQRRGIRRVLSIRRSDVATVPRGAIVRAPDKPGSATIRSWRVDGVDRIDEHIGRYLMVPIDEPTLFGA